MPGSSAGVIVDGMSFKCSHNVLPHNYVTSTRPYSALPREEGLGTSNS